MRFYRFSLVLDRKTILNADVEDFLRGFADDATVLAWDGEVVVSFERIAACLGDAVGSAICDVDRAGFGVTRMTTSP